MTSTFSLSISALGAFQLTCDGQPTPKFKYLDARELLVYLLMQTTATRAGTGRGKSKQEIGAALWGDVAGAQLNARFKARLNDVRRVLGAREWISFEREAYQFNFAPRVFFDVREFERRRADAETARRANNSDAERAALQRAIGLYRGDFMRDYHTRRSRRAALDEREWYLGVREDLQNEYRRAVGRLAQIELNAAQFDTAIELLRRLVALDEYDDTAHQQLMLALARQGRRSEALRHYQTLVRTRAEVLPDTALTALFEKIKRNENLGYPGGEPLCLRLDGMPLAIELAAARIRLFSPEEIAARLDDRFRLLTGGSRTALPRQQTLRASLDWSYSLLSERERVLFRRLAVFVGGWTFDAAEQVCTEVGAISNPAGFAEAPLPESFLLESPNSDKPKPNQPTCANSARRIFANLR